MNVQAKGLLITTVGALLVVPDSLFVRVIDAEPLVIAFWRNGVCGALIGLWVLIFRGIGPFKQVISTGRYGAIYIAATGVSGILFVLAISHTSVANAVFIIATMPVFASIFSRVFLGERISPRMVVTIVAVGVGLGIIAFGAGDTENSSYKGDMLAMLVAATFAAGLTAARRARAVSMVPALAIAYIGSSALLLLLINPFTVPPEQYTWLMAYGAFMVGSATCLALGPRYITSAEVALLMLLESVLAPLLVWFVLGENPGVWTLAGGAVVIGALTVSNAVVLMRRQRKIKT